MTGGEPPRYAVYFAPDPDSALHRFGSRWLGRDAESGAPVAQPAVAGLAAARLAELTGSPRLYGFHATLKAPFRLADGMDEADLADAAAALTASRAPFDAPPLVLAEIGGWRALVPARPCPRLQALCDELVAGLDRFRAPPTRQEVARRVGNGRLSQRQRALFDRWGYPYVFDEFSFHITLTQPVQIAEGRLLDQALAPLVADFADRPLHVAGVALFRQPDRASPFTVLRRLPFAPAATTAAAPRITSLPTPE